METVLKLYKMKKLLLLLIIVGGLWSCNNSWNSQGHWVGGTFIVNDSIQVLNREIVMAINDAKDSIQYFIRYDIDVNGKTCYQAYHPATDSKEKIINDLEKGYKLILSTKMKPAIIKRHPIATPYDKLKPTPKPKKKPNLITV